MVGYTLDEIVQSGLSMHALIHHTRADGAPYPEEECPMSRALHQGQGVRLEDEVLWRRDGTSFPAEYSGEPITIDGRIVGAVVTFVDITARKHSEAENQRLLIQAQQDRRRLDDTVNTVPGVVWEAWGTPDADGQRIAYVSKYVEQMLGYSVAEWLDTTQLLAQHRASRGSGARGPGGSGDGLPLGKPAAARFAGSPKTAAASGWSRIPRRSWTPQAVRWACAA